MAYRCKKPRQGRLDLEQGGRIILPPSTLEDLTRREVENPYLFKLTNKKVRRETHSGVLEFTADRGKVYLPDWMMLNIQLHDGDTVHIESVKLPVARFVKFEPQTVDFLDITNPKAVLENCLRNFVCLTTGDIIAFDYNDRLYEMKILETQPSSAVSILNCDVDVDFAPPVGYQEPVRVPLPQPVEEEEQEVAVDVSDYRDPSKFRAFSGVGQTLSNKSAPIKPDATKPEDIKRGVPNFNHKKGKITFIRAPRPIKETTKDKDTTKDDDDFVPFSGQGQMPR